MTRPRTPDRTRTVGVRLTDSELAAIDAARGTANRSDYIRGAVAEAIARRRPPPGIFTPSLLPPEETAAVTPPGADTPAMRDWLACAATERGFTDLRWADDVDKHGAPMGRLYGRRA